MRIRSIALIILTACLTALGQQTSNRTGSFDSLKANRDTLRFIDSARFYFSVRFDQKPRYWDAQVALFSNDTTSFRTFSDLKYLKNADSTTIRNYSNALYAPRGGGGSISDTNRFVMIDKSQSIYGFKIFLDSAEFGDAGNSAGYIRLQDGDSHVGRLRSADLSDDRLWYLPNASGTVLLNGDTTTFRTRSDSLYAWTDKANIFTTPNYFTARQYMTSLAVDTIAKKTPSGFLPIQSSVKLSGSIVSTRFLFPSSTGSLWVGTGSAPSDFDTTNLGSQSYLFGLGLVTGQNSFATGSSVRVSGDYSSAFGSGTRARGFYNFIAGSNVSDDSVNNVMLLGVNMFAKRRTLFGFGGFNSIDTIRFGHATISAGVPFVAYSGSQSAGQQSSAIGFKSDAQDTSSFWFHLYNGDPSSGTGTSTTALQLTKFKGDGDASNYERWNGNKFWVALRLDTSNNILWNDAKSSEFTYGDMKMTNGNFVVTAGSVDSDSIRDDGTTRATSGTWHSGIGAWSLGNITTGTINAGSNSITTTGAGSFGAISGTTGTFTSTLQSTQGSGGTGLRLITTGINAPSVVWYAGYLGASGTRGGSMRIDSLSNLNIANLGANPHMVIRQTGMLAGLSGTAWTGIITASAPYLVLKNSAESDGSLIFTDADDTSQRGFMTYGSGSNNLTIGNSTSNSIILDASGNTILGSTSGTVYGTGTNDLGRYDNYWDSTFVTHLIASNAVRIGGDQSTTTRFSVKNGLLANATEWYNSRGTSLASIDSVGKLQTGGLTSVGAFGVSNTMDTVTYTSMSSGLSKNLTSTVGMYRLVYTIFCTTADAAAGSVQLTLSFNNGAAQTMTSAAVNLTSTSNKDDDVFVFYVASGTPSISTAITGSAGTSKHSVHAIVERLK